VLLQFNPHALFSATEAAAAAVATAIHAASHASLDDGRGVAGRAGTFPL